MSPSSDRPDDSGAETFLRPDDPVNPGSPSSKSLDGGRFAAGTILDARYRIIGLLGRGGMGEVYRAEDLRLGETVALKFLPEELATDGAALARFHREVRTARQITHKNVVRVHDIGEIDGQPFLSMEYVDGEDLASLLRRIGRLPQDKALELARQLCAGLAAAHDRSVLHRDLKPANVMIDGQGHAKISDFGLARLAEELKAPELAGTPIYMAPEQLAEGKASFASDIFSLGLVLYEMFSGKRPYAATSRAELIDQHKSSELSPLTGEVPSLDPLIEKAVEQCLAQEPSARPESPLSVAVALPGGDPLAAALAAGETPSPEMVARAGGQAALSRRTAALLLGATIAGMLAWAASNNQLIGLALDPPLEPEVLAHRAREILAAHEWTGSPGAWSFRLPDFHARVTLREERTLDSWRELLTGRPGFTSFVYRAGARRLLATRRWRASVSFNDPPADTPGTATVVLDGQGRLRTLMLPPESNALPPSSDRAADPETDWSGFFEESGLEVGDFETIPAERAPPFFAERYHAWKGTYPGQPEPALLIDAATTQGRVTWWSLNEELVLGADQRSSDPHVVTQERGQVHESEIALGLVAFALMLAGGGWLAQRNLASGRADRKGAARIAAFIAATTLASFLVRADHVFHLGEFSLINSGLAGACLVGLAAWVVYLALEPFTRRTWPRSLTSWNRLLSGRFADPLVGRDLLIGVGGTSLLFGVMGAVGSWELASGGSLRWSFPHGWSPLYGPLSCLTNAFSFMTVLVGFGVMSLLTIARKLIRSDRWAVVAVAGLLIAIQTRPESLSLFLGGAALLGFAVFSAARFGFLSTLAVFFTTLNVSLVPVALDPSIWWARNSWISLAAVIGVALWGYQTATRGEMAPARTSTYDS